MIYGLCAEEWKPVPGYEGRYEVSNLGRIASLPNKRRHSRLIMKQAPHKRTGYLLINLTNTGDDGKWRQKSFWVARLVALAFHGEPLDASFEVCHKDGCCTNNAANNLRWDTPTANNADKKLHGTDNGGSKNPRAKLSESEVRSIKQRFRSGHDVGEIASDHNVEVTTIKSIKNGQNWSHIQ